MYLPHANLHRPTHMQQELLEKSSSSLPAPVPDSVQLSIPSSIPSFILKIYDLIETVPNDIVTWTEDDAGFLIKDTKRLERDFLHLYFNHSKLTSFVRQLSFYGFRKRKRYQVLDLSKAPVKCCEYRHPKFNRGRFDLMAGIRRKTYGSEATIGSNNDDSVRELQEKVETLTRRVESLQQMVLALQENQLTPLQTAGTLELSSDDIMALIEPAIEECQR